MVMGRAQTDPIEARRAEIPAPSAKGPMLDVQIPDIKMERYSVMFNQHTSQAAKPESPQPGLLARRQASGTRRRADSFQVSFTFRD